MSYHSANALMYKKNNLKKGGGGNSDNKSTILKVINVLRKMEGSRRLDSLKVLPKHTIRVN